MDKLWIIALLCTVGLISRAVHAELGLRAVVPAGAGQQKLCVALNAQVLELSICSAPTSILPPKQQIELPAQVQSHVAKATVAVVELGKGRRAAHVRVPLPGGESAWEALAAAPINSGTTVKLLWSGMTGLIEGEVGERHGPKIVVHGRSVLIGEQREDIGLCGRQTIVSARAVDPSDLSLRRVRLQQLTQEERNKAVRLVARRQSAGTATGSPLRATAASSAVGSPQALTDGNTATYWAENREEAGRGEFVVMRTPSALALKSFHFQLHPTGGTALPTGVAPKELWLATDDQLFQVNFPENGWQPEAPSYVVDLPKPIHVQCVAVVLEQAHDKRKDAQVTISELWAGTEIGQNWAELVSNLEQGGDVAAAAAEALRFGGEPAFAATAQAFSALGVGARPYALEVLDQAACSVSAASYWEALQSAAGEERAQAQRRVARCSTEITGLILSELEKSKGAKRKQLIEALAVVAPAAVAERAPHWLAGASVRERATVRRSIAAVAPSPDAEALLRTSLRTPTLAPMVQLDLLRALSPRALAFAPQYPQAFQRLVQTQSTFEQQYLLLEPAGALANSNEIAAKLIREQLTNPKQPHLRAEAARRANAKQFQTELITATRDAEVRVRLAAVESLTTHSAGAAPALLERLTEDDWPIVRAASVRALLSSPGAAVDEALARALRDESRHVKRAAAYSLGRRGARSQAAALRETLVEAEEDPAVRAAAATALGQLCDQQAVAILTEYVEKLSSPAVTTAELWLGQAALGALADLQPKDLKEQLQPLLAKNAPAEVRRMTKAALARPGKCSADVASRSKKGER